MRFRTELEIKSSPDPIAKDCGVVSLGSCFSQAIGTRLLDGGLDVAVTPMGILFNPISIGKVVLRALSGKPFGHDDLFRDDNGVWHALSFESRRQNTDPDALLDEINRDFLLFRDKLTAAATWLVTFGTAWCFRHLPSDAIVGNCHKLPDSQFERHLATVEEIVGIWNEILLSAPRVVFTVSPVRHLNDGLHGNTLSKARLHLAVEQLCLAHDNASYFPAFEALNDDLRDYRFYADDLKHPSPMAEEYIFDLFIKCYFTEADRRLIYDSRHRRLAQLHRPIIRADSTINEDYR